MSSAMGSRFVRGALAAFVALTISLLGIGTAYAQSDLLDQARKLKEVAAQKLEAEVRDALLKAQTAEPAKAAAVLRQTLALLEQDTSLSPERRDSLKQLLQTRLRAIDGNAVRTPDPTRPVFDANRRAEEQARAQEQEQIERGLVTVRQLQGQGKFREAEQVARELGQKFPNSPAAAAISRVAPTADRLVDLRSLRTESERRFAAVGNSVERSAMPAVDDVEFPRDWATKVAKRTTGIRMTDKEKAIVDALNSPVTVDFEDSRFEDVLKKLEEATGQTIIVDKQAMNEAQVTYDTPVRNVKLKNVTFRTALRKVLGDMGLTYIVKDQTIQVMTPARARDTMTTRTYYMGDLLFVAGVNLPPALSQLQMAQTVAMLMDLITRTVDPGSWQVNGGQGSITFYPPTMSLIIRQSAEMHFVLGSGIGGSR